MNALNLPEFNILHVEENDYDYRFTVEKKDKPETCPECSHGELYSHGVNDRIIRDVNMHGKRVGILLRHKRYKCRLCGKTFMEPIECVEEDAKITTRLFQQLGTLAFKRPFDQIAEEFGVSATTVKRAFGFCTSVLDKMQEDIKTPRVLGIDEVHIDHDMRAVFCDVENGLILDMCEKRSKATISKFLKRLNRSKVRVVTMDMWQPYHNAVSEVLPKAVRIVDKFHVIQYGNKALDIVRKEIKDSDAQKRLKKERYLLLKNKESLSDVDIQRLDAWFAAFPRLQQAYALKESLRDMYTATDKQTALELFEDWCGSISTDMPAYLDVRNMIERWKEPIFNYFDHPITNAYTESANNLIKHIHKAGRGYSFEVLRAKVLYGTKATRKPKYAEADFSQISFKMTSFTRLSFDDEPIQGFGVSISTLSRIFENEEF